MSAVFLDLSSLIANTTYTVTSMQWLPDASGYFYIITMTVVGDAQVYSMAVYQGTALVGIYDHLDYMRKNSLTAQFQIEKELIQISNSYSQYYPIIIGLNDIVTLT